jgi:NAD+ synthase
MTNSSLPIINPKDEKERIVAFLKQTFAEQKISKAIIGISGGIDSAVSFTLLREALGSENVFTLHMYYFDSKFEIMQKFISGQGVPQKNIHHFSIKNPVDSIIELQKIDKTEENNIRIGNIAARMRMILLYDLAKKYNALVCGTENKSENLLGYFTRFGDQASDIEPIEHLYKTHIVTLAKYLSLPDEIIMQAPSAGLWQGQTDEGQFGFSYEEADQVLFLYFEKRLSIEIIEKKGFSCAKKIIDWTKKNHFKNSTPYRLTK